jgi:hypothetical protein
LVIRHNMTQQIDILNNDETDDDIYIEQAEYIERDKFLEWSADQPNEEYYVGKLSRGGAKLLVGPRGCGKTTLMLKAYYSLLDDPNTSVVPIYVNFKLSLQLEPLYINTQNASFHFRRWLVLKTYLALWGYLDDSNCRYDSSKLPSKSDLKLYISDIESGKVTKLDSIDTDIDVSQLLTDIKILISIQDKSRCVLLFDDAAHAFSPKQQEDFFEFFRQVKSKEVSPKAAIYPGITTHSPTFHVGHDAEEINVWMLPNSDEYMEFSRNLIKRRIPQDLSSKIFNTPGALELLAFASFGIPRSFLNMIRSLKSNDGRIDKRSILDAIRLSRDSSHHIFESLKFKVPTYKVFIDRGNDVYQNIISLIKNFNTQSEKSLQSQGYSIGIKRPIPNELAKVLDFFQYAGLLMSSGENSRGEKGVFDIFLVHFGDLVTSNALVGRRTKSVEAFVSVLKTKAHQAYPRVSPERIAETNDFVTSFPLSLPKCQVCGTERINEHSKFCHHCGSQLKSSSLYDELVNQDISVLQISKRMISRIRNDSNIRTIKDVFLDEERRELRSVAYVGPKRAQKIYGYAEEHVA